MFEHKRKTRFALIFTVVYTFVILCFFRFFIIPKFATSEMGEIVGDTLEYAKAAIFQANQMKTQGWSVFQFQPDGHGSAGIASILYYFTGTLGWVILVNSLLHIISVTALFQILRLYFSEKSALAACAPFALSVGMMYWFAETNKDSYSICGIFLFLLGYLRIINPAASRKKSIANLLQSFLIMAAGISLIYLVRSYLLQLIFYCLIANFAFLLFSKDRKFSFIRNSLVVLFVLIIIKIPDSSRSAITFERFTDFKSNSQLLGYVESADTVASKCLAYTMQFHTSFTFLPDSLIKKFQAISGQRCFNLAVLTSNPNPTVVFATVDSNIFFKSIEEILLYIPRAIQISFFQPWPDTWIPMFKQKTSIILKFPIPELILFYLTFPLLFCLLFMRKIKLELIISLLTASAVLIFTGLTSPFLIVNNRYRYPWWIFILSVAIAASFENRKYFFRLKIKPKKTLLNSDDNSSNE